MRFHVPTLLRWSDLDAYNHVNNSRVLTLLEEARVRAFWNIGASNDDERPLAIIDAAAEGGDTLTLIARNEIEYLAPIPYSTKPLDVQLWISKMGAASAEVDYEIWSPEESQPEGAERVRYVIASSTLVFIDAATQRPRRINEREREAWTPYLDEPLTFRGGRSSD
ncbi:MULTISPECIES: acyl-CoA thioesterase [unclassified Pseudoclavibacter]|uniref:acyl-CoA thioesterase n=1 Tax=unclassified Pseudoclavibacter TaxID=2615177 RepID=UPI000CE8C3F4|nr:MULTISPECIES: thioesterase family protein [unclassified Pseudoclavibacter]MBS3179642.1 acyl-CoA thioesterase [Pseudoclavibacter sp. Marseille-Q4354]NYF14533.1 acyl-CoA thioester hydrolase [Pseudoclavibacter sp. JAI123]PPG30543.1 4-hydroxybenzoyl-CoA thioesterase [Pseudoclavibacter sp. RFBB5]